MTPVVGMPKIPDPMTTEEILAEQRAYYDARAEEYDRDLQTGQRLPPMADLRFLLDLPKEFAVLELGCGSSVRCD